VIILTTVVMDTGIRLASSASTYTKRLLSPFHIPPPVLFHLEVSPVDYFVFVFVLLSYSLDKPLDKPFAITMPLTNVLSLVLSLVPLVSFVSAGNQGFASKRSTHYQHARNYPHQKRQQTFGLVDDFQGGQFFELVAPLP
jgi:hypothetical protein